MATLYNVDGSQREVQPQDGESFKLAELQGFVGGYIEIVPLHSSGKLLVVNEEGKLEHLPINPGATEVWEKEYGPTDIIVGNALLCEDHEIQ